MSMFAMNNNQRDRSASTGTEELYCFLQMSSAVKADFNMLITRLKRRQLTGAQQCARATLELLRSVLARLNFTSTEHMMRVVKLLGRELSYAAPSELTIGNLVRRVLYVIREEHAHHQINGAPQQLPGVRTAASRRGSFCDEDDLIIESTPQEPLSPTRNLDVGILRQMPTLESTLGQLNLNSLSAGTDDFSKQFIGLKGAVLAALNEMTVEIDNFTTIAQKAQDFIHVDECILTYGYSKLVEVFLKAAGAKRRFQLIIAEAAPGMEGHKLAQNLIKTPNISITLIPDSNIYAMMARVNKVIFSPLAIMADGGSIANSGLLMVATAAKEFSVPIVGISGAFTLTPVFAHNQQQALQQLLSPTNAIPYNADINFQNVEVSYPAFDLISPNLVSLYITNDGTQLPSYIFRQLSEYYHPKDYIL